MFVCLKYDANTHMCTHAHTHTHTDTRADGDLATPWPSVQHQYIPGTRYIIDVVVYFQVSSALSVIGSYHQMI